jgi:hypothetical protein
MPNISASDYTKFLKFKAASASSIRPAIQTRDNVTLSQSLINAETLASQAAFRVDPNTLLPTISPAVVTAASSRTVTDALSKVVSAANGSGTIITYTAVDHGLTTGMTVQISGLSIGTLSATPNRTGVITVTGVNTFTIDIGSAVSGASSGTGIIVGRVYYTTSVAHGLAVGDVISITGITTFTASNATVLAVTSATTFVLSSTIDGTTVTGATGTIVGRVYYTTDVAHGLTAIPPNKYITVSGVTTFSIEKGTLVAIPSTTVFALAGTIVGAVTSQTGTLISTVFSNQNVAITGLNYVRPMPPNNVNNPYAKATLTFSGSGATSSSKFVQLGGLPASGRVGPTNYTRLPQNAGWIQGGGENITSGPKRF